MSLERAVIMRFIVSSEPILWKLTIKRVYILQCGHQMLFLSVWLVILMSGMMKKMR